jgi:hypothetical protein
MALTSLAPSRPPTPTRRDGLSEAATISSRNSAAAGGKVRFFFLITRISRWNAGSSIGFDFRLGSARISLAEAGSTATPRPAFTMPTAVIM